jgi:catechol-2,3-dioxygenase
MEFDRVQIPAVDPPTLAEWYGDLFGVDTEETVDSTASTLTQIQLGETTLQFVSVEAAPPAHLAFRLLATVEAAVDWLADRATMLPVEDQQYRWFDFLDATAIYFEDPEGNVLEGLCYKGDSRRSVDPRAAVDGVTEVGLPAHEPLTLVEWLQEAVGLSAWGNPSDTFAWVGDRHARFVVVPAARDWSPTDRQAGLGPLSATVVDPSARPGRHSHPTVPYEIVVAHE